MKLPLDEFTKRLKDVDEKTAIIALTSAEDSGGKPFYIYLEIPPTKYPEYLETHKRDEEIKFSDYGKILKTGPGYPPPKEVREEMEAKGFNHNFEADAMKALEAEVKFVTERGIKDLDSYVKAKRLAAKKPIAPKSFLPLREPPKE